MKHIRTTLGAGGRSAGATGEDQTQEGTESGAQFGNWLTTTHARRLSQHLAGELDEKVQPNIARARTKSDDESWPEKAHPRKPPKPVNGLKWKFPRPYYPRLENNSGKKGPEGPKKTELFSRRDKSAKACRGGRGGLRGGSLTGGEIKDIQ